MMEVDNFCEAVKNASKNNAQALSKKEAERNKITAAETIQRQKDRAHFNTSTSTPTPQYKHTYTLRPSGIQTKAQLMSDLDSRSIGMNRNSNTGNAALDSSLIRYIQAVKNGEWNIIEHRELCCLVESYDMPEVLGFGGEELECNGKRSTTGNNHTTIHTVASASCSGSADSTLSLHASSSTFEDVCHSRDQKRACRQTGHWPELTSCSSK
mmetsp:Transcript_19487/g.34772  ORF Transcript_19487/g.34772 Transcript_19487/m.34772 type:complete len:211 (+) Transcript_19487:1365-1997(+)